VSLGHPSKFRRVSPIGFVTAATSHSGRQPIFARCLAVSWTGTLCIHFPGLLPRNGILPRAKFTLRQTLAFSYIGSVIITTVMYGTRAVGVSESVRRRTSNGITELSQRAPPIFSWAAITLGIGTHSSLKIGPMFHVSDVLLQNAFEATSPITDV